MCSPRAWGWTAGAGRAGGHGRVFPTRVGVDRRPPAVPRPVYRVPHARGGGPTGSSTTRAWRKCSPRAWGWTVGACLAGSAAGVFPTRVGVDRTGTAAYLSRPRVPHARGGGPSEHIIAALVARCSPRAWGWTVTAPTSSSAANVFPTRVGVDRQTSWLRSRRRGVPHARGGGPCWARIGGTTEVCSPRAWGWTVVAPLRVLEQIVFPTRVGVDREIAPPPPRPPSVPHARGGGPKGYLIRFDEHECSPRAWGWTVGAVQVGVAQVVFPTRVGVDRERAIEAHGRWGVPHARGGGPLAPRGGCA